MTKERRNEILDLVIKHIRPGGGLCSTIMALSIWGQINDIEADQIRAILNKNRPKHDWRFVPFWWDLSDRQSRIEFCEKLKQLP